MKVICGLGNPGKAYENTHHNMGFLVLDEIAESLGVKINKLKFKALIAETSVDGEKLLLVKPQTFMNSSGESLREIMSFYKLKASDLLVIYDDIDIPLGTLRFRIKGSAGSHNGMKSIIYQLCYDDFSRLRVGVGTNGNIPLIEFVLSSITSEEKKQLEKSIPKARDGALIWLKDGNDKAALFCNKKEEENG